MRNLSKELIIQIIADGGFQTPKDIGDYLKDMFKDVIQEILEKELTLELGYEKVDSLNKHTENRRWNFRCYFAMNSVINCFSFIFSTS